MWERDPRSTVETLRWRAICSDSTKRFLEGGWRYVFISGFGMSGNFPAPRSCAGRLRAILWRRGNIFPFVMWRERLRKKTLNLKFEIGNSKRSGDWARWRDART